MMSGCLGSGHPLLVAFRVAVDVWKTAKWTIMHYKAREMKFSYHRYVMNSWRLLLAETPWLEAAFGRPIGRRE